MRNYLILPLIALLFLSSLFTGAQQVISAAGATASGTGVQLSWTVGEPVIETFTGTGAVLTQGFHQSRLSVTSADQYPNPDFSVSVYPNPVSSYLKLEINNGYFKDINFMLFGQDGKLLFSGKAEMLPELINMNNYPAGTYLLKVVAASPERLHTFKIIKN